MRAVFCGAGPLWVALCGLGWVGCERPASKAPPPAASRAKAVEDEPRTESTLKRSSAGRRLVTKASNPRAVATPGGNAPQFALPSVDGASVRLADLKGKVVVLEWFNPDCPFVKHAHTEGPLRDMASRWMGRGVAWVAINSSAPGKQGHGKERNVLAKAQYKLNHPVLLDESGDVGRLYGAQKTPQVVVIDGDGVVQYMGALDNMPHGDTTEPGAKPTSYLEDALTAVVAGKAPPLAATKPWGCSVKYDRP